MNFKIVRQILENPNIRDTHDLAVLIVLAYHADENGECWPSMSMIANEARLAGENTARILMKRLAQAEFFTIQRGHGRGNRNHYRLQITHGKVVARKPRFKKAFSESPFEERLLPKSLSETEKSHPEKAFLNAPEISNVVSVEESNKQTDCIVSGEIADNDELVAQLVALGVNVATAEQLTAKYPERIALQIEWLEARNPRDRAATLVQAVRQNWSPPAAIRHAEMATSTSQSEGDAPEPQKWQQKGEQTKAAVGYDEAEGKARDTEFAALSPEQQSTIDRACTERLELIAPFLRTEHALKMMGRTVLSERGGTPQG